MVQGLFYLINVLQVPKDIHILILGTCEDITLFGRRDLADGIKIKDPEMGRVSWIIQVNLVQSRESLKQRVFPVCRERALWEGLHPPSLVYKDGGGGGMWKQKKEGDRFFPGASRGNTTLQDLILDQQHSCGTDF